MANGTSNGSSTTTYQIPRPSVPGVLSDNLRQNVSVYKALRSVIDVINQQPSTPAAGSITFYGSMTPATDGKPGTFTQGSLDAQLIRVAGNGKAAGLGLTYEWASGGAQTAIGHTLNRVPVGWIICRINGVAQIYEGSNTWTTTTIWLNTTHSDEDAIILVF